MTIDDPSSDPLERLLREVRACAVCAPDLPLGPRPVVQVGRGARVLIIGQAPGTKVHASGVPWSDPSGERLRDWTGIDAATFYDPAMVAMTPMGFCYPGVAPGGGDAPPRPPCAPLWHARLREHLSSVRLTLLVGLFAQKAYLPKGGWTLTQAVRGGVSVSPDMFPLPHPSWRSVGWMRRNPWFEAEIVPALRERVRVSLRSADESPFPSLRK